MPHKTQKRSLTTSITVTEVNHVLNVGRMLSKVLTKEEMEELIKRHQEETMIDNKR
jgi:hypothetical protein